MTRNATSKKKNVTCFETSAAAVFETKVAVDTGVAGETDVGDGAENVVADSFAVLLSGGQPARAGPLIEATCCKTTLGNDSILVEPGAWIIGSAGDFVNQTRPQIRDSFSVLETVEHNDLIRHTIAENRMQKSLLPPTFEIHN